MKKTMLLFVPALVACIMLKPSFAEEASVELGKKLFNNPGLGASENSLSCNTCHNDGEDLHNAAGNPDLAAVINKCIVGPLKGEALNEDTVAMKSLILYISSLGK